MALARMRADLAAFQMRWARVKLAWKYSPTSRATSMSTII